MIALSPTAGRLQVFRLTVPGCFRLPLLLVMALWLTLAGTARAAPHAPSDIGRITARGELVVAVPSFDAPPFFFRRNGELEGVDIELARGLAEALSVKARFDRRGATFNAALERVASGAADVAICKLSRTLARAARVRFSEPYLRFNHALVINRLRFAEIAHGQDLAKVIRHYTGSIGVIEQSSFADFAVRNFPSASLVTYRDWDAVVAALKRGEITAAYRDQFEIDRIFKLDPRMALTLRTVTFSDLEDTLGIAVAPDSSQLLSVINLFLSQRREKLTVESLLKRLDEARP
jgi:ABC-type amino acid transport substrate-binding protein